MTAPTHRWYSSITRDTILVGLGVALAIYEVVLREGPERPFTIGFIATLLGLPAVLRADVWRRNGNGGST